ncbi:2'-5' RNA ligase family protein [Bacillus sp. NPDC057893]|uniref:2'-5' RNA ligase family protein n=1 Tax=Bacillus sp. NPDC057893 TaxID=3346273 RepID=UPI00366FF36D
MRTILLFLNNMSTDEIESIREIHDPLFGLIPPHITSVFPFESNISNISKGIGTIEIKFASGVTSIGDYLFLEIEQGKEQIEELHDKLYTGPLLPLLRKDIPYIPHVTVGRKESSQLATELARDLPCFHEKLHCVIDRMSVERIGENGESIIEFEVSLQRS